MKNHRNNRYKTLLLLIFIFLISVIPSFAGTSFTPDLPTGTWQMIVDGKPAEGAFFYRLEFKEDQTVVVTKQSGGQNLKETKKWSLDEKQLKIVSSPGSEILELDQAMLTYTEAKVIQAKIGEYTGLLEPHNYSIGWIHWVLILVGLMGLNELFRRSKWAGAIFYFVLPIVLLPVWMSHGVTYWFKWVKLYSVVGASAWFILIRFTKLGKYDAAKLVAALFLALNIGEAVTQDFSMGYLPNTLNAIAGALSIATLFYGWKGIHADNTKEHDMIWPKMTIFWIVAYDIWNWVFVYLNFPGSASAQLMVLLSCTLPALFIKKGTWLQARAFTLAAWFMYYFTFARFTERMELLVPRNGSLMMAAALISIGANGIYAIIYVRRLMAERRKIF